MGEETFLPEDFCNLQIGERGMVSISITSNATIQILLIFTIWGIPQSTRFYCNTEGYECILGVWFNRLFVIPLYWKVFAGGS